MCVHSRCFNLFVVILFSSVGKKLYTKRMIFIFKFCNKHYLLRYSMLIVSPKVFVQCCCVTAIIVILFYFVTKVTGSHIYLFHNGFCGSEMLVLADLPLSSCWQRFQPLSTCHNKYQQIILDFLSGLELSELSLVSLVKQLQARNGHMLQ